MCHFLKGNVRIFGSLGFKIIAKSKDFNCENNMTKCCLPSQRRHITLLQGLRVLKIEKLDLVFNIRYPWHQCQKNSNTLKTIDHHILARMMILQCLRYNLSHLETLLSSRTHHVNKR